MDSFFYLDANNQQKGPVPADKLLSVGVDANTLVWKQGMASWMKAGQVAELGTHQELLEKNGIYRDLYETQFRQVLDMQGLEEKELEWEEKKMIQNDVY